MRTIVASLLLCICSYSAIAQDWLRKHMPKDGTANSIALNDTIISEVEQSLNSQSPNLLFQDIYSGKRDSLTSFRGKVVMVNVWNIHCGSCIEELPVLKRIQSKLSKKGFVLLAISPDNAVNQRYFFDSKKLNLGGITSSMHPQDYIYPFQYLLNPSAYIIDRKGVLREFWVGTKTYEELSSTIAKYL